MFFIVLLSAAVSLASATTTRIVNGQLADIGEYPWQGVWNTAAGSLTCGCILVHQKWVLTAGHCVSSTGYTAEFGSNTRGQGIKYAYEFITRHPDYDEGVGFTNNDIAVVKIVEPGVDLTQPNVRPVEGFDIGIDRTRQTCFISGWGKVCGGPFCELPMELQEVQIPVIDEATCRELWGGSFNPRYHICLYDAVNQNIGSCNGDSGGPLVCQNNGKWELCGITSWGYSGCNTAYPSVYTRLSSYNTFVCEVTNNEVCW